MLYYIANNAIINDNNELNEYRRFSMTNSPSTLQGYLLEDFRLFHLKDQTSRTYSFHHHDFLKIMILLSGNVTYVVEGRSYPLAPWDMVLVDRGQIHRPVVDTAHPYERILLYLSPTFLETYSTKEAPLTRCFETAQYRHSQVLRLSQETLAPFKVLLQKLETNTNFRNDDFAAPLLAKALCLEFLIELNRITLSPKAGFLTESTLDYRISGLLAYINSHLEEPMDVASLSALSGLSSYHMMRLFKQETGIQKTLSRTPQRHPEQRLISCFTLSKCSIAVSIYQCIQLYSLFAKRAFSVIIINIIGHILRAVDGCDRASV